MVLWQGLTKDGTAVPVQVTDEGLVLSQGQAGPAGPEGPQGPEGPPGETFPPDPFEGAVLTYINGAPTWHAPDPVPVPGTYIGPVTWASAAPFESATGDKYNRNITQFLNDAGVTAITGLGLVGRGDGYTTQIDSFTISNVEISTDEVVSTPENPLSGTTWDKWLKSPKATSYCQGGNVPEYWCSFPPMPSQFGAIRLSTGFGPFFIIDQDGNRITVFGDGGAGTTIEVFSPIDESAFYVGREIVAADMSGQMIPDPDAPGEPKTKGNITAVDGQKISVEYTKGAFEVNDYVLATETKAARWIVNARHKV